MNNQTMQFQARKNTSSQLKGAAAIAREANNPPTLSDSTLLRSTPANIAWFDSIKNIKNLDIFCLSDRFPISLRKFFVLLVSTVWIIFEQHQVHRIRKNKLWKQHLLIAIVTISSLFLVAFTFNQTDDEQLILEATLSITMFVPDSNEAAETRYIASDGLATLFADGDQTFIATHDHWSLFDSDQGFVQFSNAAGEILLGIELDAFKSLILHRDGGTTIMNVPEGLENLKPAKLAKMIDNQSLETDDTMLLVHRNDGLLTIVEAGLEKASSKQGQATIRMESLNGEFITRGDSGGGVWVNGKLVGNMWTTIMMENISTGAHRPTTYSIAALFPHAAMSPAFISN